MILKSTAVVAPNTKIIDYPFNFAKPQNSLKNNVLNIKRKSSRVIEFKLDKEGIIQKLKLTGVGLIFWDDFWENNLQEESDPQIVELELQNSLLLQTLNIPFHREHLKSVNLAGCKSLQYLNISQSPNLESLDLNRCSNLREIQLGLNPNLRNISLRWCELSERSLEIFLSGFRPTKGEIKNEYGTTKYLSSVDLRGNIIPWDNRRIASKIRMLLLNNIGVAWDNNPPESIIPLELYRNLQL